jgi:DNA-directed RNA polymerase specialized sigma24 family protein
MRSSRPECEVDVTEVAHACFVAYVRAELGVRDADLPGLCHEVFLVVQEKAHVIAVIDRLDLWLRAICRRVAADHRLRSARRYIA